MNAVKDFFYQRIVTLARGVTIAQGLKFRTWGEENIPDKGAAVLVVNHTGYVDLSSEVFYRIRRSAWCAF